MSNVKTRPKLDENEFLNGAGNVQPIQKEPEDKRQPLRPEPKIHKTVRMPRWISDELRKEATDETIRTGVVVSQESIVQAVLEEYYKDKKP